MPQLDMPLEQLLTYSGSSPLPKDFDNFWDSALQEMRSIDPNTLIKEAEFKVPFATCYHLTFTGTGNARIYAKMVKPNNLIAPAPAVIRFHGYTGNSGDWTSLLTYAASGMIAIAMDCRGQGGLSEDSVTVKGGTLFGFIVKGVEEGPEKLYFKHVFLDTAKLAGIVLDMADVDKSKVYAAGGSQGGALTLACAALEPRISKLVPVFPFLSDYKRVWNMDLAIDAYVGIRDYFRRFDPTHAHEDDFFHTLGYIDIQNLAPRIRGEVLLGLGLMDNICPPSTQFACYNKITSIKNYVIYPDFGHEHLPGFSDTELAFLLKGNF
jgi:cephalosporin-C deacetylase